MLNHRPRQRISSSAPRALQAIETSYAGCRFRSRLEARWAVFFDHLGVAWEHEPEGFETSAGRYLPDFRIELHFPFATWTWFEVKPCGAPNDPKHAAFVAGGNYLTVARGMPRDYRHQHGNLNGQPTIITHTPAKPNLPSRSDRVGFWAHASGATTTFAGLIDEGNRTVDAAYAAARSARFEHGQDTRRTVPPMHLRSRGAEQ